jgi:hypothetical protein
LERKTFEGHSIDKQGVNPPPKMEGMLRSEAA